MLIKLMIAFGYEVVGAPRRITAAWGLTIPKSGPAYRPNAAMKARKQTASANVKVTTVADTSNN